MFSPNRSTLSEEKRRLENRITTMEEDLEEEQMNSESAVEKARRAHEQVEQMSSEISQFQSTISKLEKTKSQLEKQVSQDVDHIKETWHYIRVGQKTIKFRTVHLSYLSETVRHSQWTNPVGEQILSHAQHVMS